jgi:hypothetical protein
VIFIKSCAHQVVSDPALVVENTPSSAAT